MNFEGVLQQIGEFGRYQKLLYLLLCLPGLFGSMQIIQTLIFHFAVPNHRCKIPGWQNDSYEVQNDVHKHIINITIPRSSDFYGNEEYTSCKLYTIVNSTDDYYDVGNATAPCQGWVYDQTQFISTIAQSLDMVCDKKSLVSIGKMMVMLGQLISSFFVGILSDTFGRRPVIIVNVFLLVVMSILLTWVESIPLLMVVLFFIFQSSNGQYLTCFVFGMEIVSPSKRMWTGITMNLFWSGGNMVIALSAYLLRDWRTRQLVISLPGIIFAYFYFIPESPRWLLKHGRLDEAKSVLRKMAAGNKTYLDNEDLNDITDNEDTNTDTERIWNILKSPILLRRMCIICFNWFAISMSFYGLSMNVTNLSGDIYLNFFLFVLLEVFAYILCYFLMDRLGRKKLLCMFLIATGAACILPIVPVLISDTPNQWAINILAIIGNTCASVNFAVVYTFTSELSPTTTRNSCIGFGSFSARVGSIISPYIVDLTLYITGRYGQILPMMIFGVTAALAGFLSLLLPETLNKRLPETIKEAEKLGTPAYDEDTHEGSKTPCLNKETQEVQEKTLMNTSTC